MGGFGEMAASPMARYGMMGAAKGAETGSGIANAMYNAASLRQQAKAVTAQSDLTSYLIREQYAQDYRTLREQQVRQQSMNRVLQAKHGISGTSASEVMQTYAAKQQKNLNALYYNAAMKTGQQSLVRSEQRNMMLEKARQYDWKAKQVAVSGLLNFASGALNQYGKDLGNVDPNSGLNLGHDSTIIETKLGSFTETTLKE